jgi:hypothetical protein
MNINELPEELLNMVLEFVLTTDQPFSAHEDPYPALGEMYGQLWQDQWLDWRMVNSTSQKIRRIGKPLFFRLRPFSMALDPDLKEFANGRVPQSLIPQADSHIALREIRSFHIPGGDWFDSTYWSQLTCTLQRIPTMRECTVRFRIDISHPSRIMCRKPNCGNEETTSSSCVYVQIMPASNKVFCVLPDRTIAELFDVQVRRQGITLPHHILLEVVIQKRI